MALYYPRAVVAALEAPYSGISIGDAFKAANLADSAYSAAVRRAGYRDRWACPHEVAMLMPQYVAKVAADQQMHLAFEVARARARQTAA